jgi:SAM-dependent methyltransferase
MNPIAGQDQMEADDRRAKGHVHYEPISHFSFNRMMKQLEWNFRESTFMDFGCGKGAAIILASRYEFKKYSGIEYSPELAEECRVNLRKFMNRSKKKLDCEIICSDATTYLVPPDVNVFYFFNPFNEVILDSVLQNIEQSLKTGKRDILLLYFNALHKDILVKYGYTPVYTEAVDKMNIWYEGGNYAFLKQVR